MTELFILVGAFSSVVILVTLAKIHRQIDDLLTILKKVTTSIKGDTSYVRERMDKMEGELDNIYEKQNQPAPENIKWKG